MEVGNTVKVLAPFNESFTSTYTIVEVITHDDGQIVYILSDDAGGFALHFIEVVNDNNNS